MLRLDVAVSICCLLASGMSQLRPAPGRELIGPGLDERALDVRSYERQSPGAAQAVRGLWRFWAGSGPHALARRVVQRLGAHLAADPVAEDVDCDPRSRLGMRRWNVRVRDARADRIAVPAARHSADDLVAAPDGLRAERDRARVVEHDAHELLPQL